MKKTRITLIIIVMFLFMFNINKINAAEELPDGGAKISSSVVTQTKTGTGPFDENDEPGNDSSEDNNIVRSFDQVTWTIENTMVLNNSEANSYSGGRIYFEAVLPDVFTSETAKWDLESMAWIENAQVSSDGLILTGHYQMSSDNITVPGKQTLVFVAKILGAANEIEFQPTIKLWLNGNDEEEHKTVIPEKTIISAAPKYNIKLVRNSGLNKRVNLDYGEEDTYGRIYGYAIILQLYNDNGSKELKGIEYPKGDITFDLELKLERSAISAPNFLENITEEANLILWNYKINTNTRDGNIPGRTMYFNVSSGVFAHGYAPLGMPRGDRKNSVYNSGIISMKQLGSRISVKVSDYKFDGVFPIYNDEYNSTSGIKYGNNIGCFSVGYFQLFVPENDITIKENYNYYLTVKDVNFLASSISGVETNVQQNISDDEDKTTHVRFRSGSYSHHIYLYNEDCSQLIQSSSSLGDALGVIGSKFSARSWINISQSNEENVLAIDRLFKFDGEGIEPSIFSDGSKFKLYGIQNMNFRIWYVTKKDGTNWISQEEMNNSTIDDGNLQLYENYDNIPDSYICVGVYFESQSGYIPPQTTSNSQYAIVIPLKLKENAKINQTYGMTQTSRYWITNLDREKYSQSIVNSYDSYPKAEYINEGQNYIKTEYDENGIQISGTHNGAHMYGQTILVVGANQLITQTTVDENNNKKINYDLAKNENIVRYKIGPSIYQDVKNKSEISNVTLTITDILPKGLTYVPGSSNYGEPEVVINDDETTTLIWYINNCITDKKIDELYFEAQIDETTQNGTQYENKATISTNDKRVGNTPINRRTSTSTIQVINLSSHRLYKIVETPVIEKNGEIHFTVSYKNNTDEIIPDFQMLDILPYNGDSRGTEYTGDYTLDRIVVTQQNGGGENISNDNLEILYTNDESVRNGVTSKDENLGAGWNSVNSETIKQKATAYAVKGEIGAQGSVTVDIYLKTNENKGLDKYVNSATAQVYKETEEMITSNVVSQVVERSIEGIAWEDSNRNGVKDEREQVLSNVEIKLTDELGQQVTDVNGNIVTSIKTDENGYYKFENLPKGNYYVQVTIPNEKYELTEKQVGTNNEINSKFDEEEKETDKIEGLNSIDLPELTVSYVNAGFVKIEGSIEITKVDKEDNSNVIEGATFKVEKIDESGNIDNTFEAQELTTGEDGKVLFEKLEVGKYRVTEVKAPSGYELLKDSIDVEITGENREIKLVAENELKLELPETGSINYTIIFAVVGISIIILAIILNKKYKVIKIKK